MSYSTLYQVDVFATASLTGNGLAVFLNTDQWSTSAMQRLTQECRQFESIFLSAISPVGAAARVFTVEEELPFAGHPVLGAAAVLHRTQAPLAESRSWVISLAHRNIPVTTDMLGTHYLCEMNQGKPTLSASVPDTALTPILTRLGLRDTDVVSGVDAQVISTGLPYLIVPVAPTALARARISGMDFEAQLSTLGAKFILLLATEGREMRTWDNLGKVEDVATGSAAGPAASYLLTHGLASPERPIELAQGQFTGRPSKIAVIQDQDDNLIIRGEVWPVSHSELDMDPLKLGDNSVG